MVVIEPDVERGRRFLAARGAAHPLVVGVTGAHFYGFPSRDSDLDLKGIHVAPTAHVVSLSPPPETIDVLEVFEGLEVDFTTHEIGLALRLLLKGNGNMLERIVSPWQLVAGDGTEELGRVARAAVSKRFYYHYRGFFRRKCHECAADPVTAKGLLYAYRSALTGIHLLRTGECVGDLTVLAPLHGFDRSLALVEAKRAAAEHDPIGEAGEYRSDWPRLEAALDEAFASSPLPEAADAGPADELLVRLRRAHF